MSDSGAFYDKDARAAIGIFKGFLTTDQFKGIANELHAIRKKNFSTKQLNDIQDMKVLTRDVQEWLDSTWFPEAVATGLKHFAFVVPKDIFGKLSMENANKNQNGNNVIEIQYFDNMDKAKNWLKSK